MDVFWHPYTSLVADLIDTACSAGDNDATEALFLLADFSATHTEFLYVYAKTLEDGLSELDKKAALWNVLDREKQFAILEELLYKRSAMPDD